MNTFYAVLKSGHTLNIVCSIWKQFYQRNNGDILIYTVITMIGMPINTRYLSKAIRHSYDCSIISTYSNPNLN